MRMWWEQLERSEHWTDVLKALVGAVLASVVVTALGLLLMA